MVVEIIDHTQDALNLLLMTKNTRLENNDDPSKWPIEKQMEHLDYMRDTIKSSWAFVNYTFRISGVTRAFTHQFIRGEGAMYPEGEYAQESQRTVDVRKHETIEPDFATEFQAEEWFHVDQRIKQGYSRMIDNGMPVQDARGILPTNISTSIIGQKTLRQLHFDGLVRLCVRTQGEHQLVFRAMRFEVLKLHPWAEKFIDVACVSEGTCAFPRYGKSDCPIYDPAMDLTELKNRTKEKFWASPMHDANPKAKDGKTM